MKFLKILTVLLFIGTTSYSQSKTTEALGKKYDAMAFFFYNNTLRMLNQKDDKAFDELIKDIEKMKFLIINNFNTKEYKKVVTDYKAETFEGIMTSRYNGKSLDIYLKEKDGKQKGMVVLVNDSTNLYVLDIVGSVALNNVTKLFQTLDESSDLGKKIKSFTEGGKPEERKDDDDDDKVAVKVKTK